MVETMPLVLARPTCMRLWSLRSPYVPQTEKTVDMVHEIMELALPVCPANREDGGHGA